MIVFETIRSILELAVHAPSGENAQPWRFEVAGDTISLFNVPENDQSLYNFAQRASYISHGALIENINIASSHFGLSAAIELVSEDTNSNLIARIILKESGIVEDPLYPYIEKRSTNRKFYKNTTIEPSLLEEFSKETMGFGEVGISFVSDPSKIRELATTASMNDRLLLENRSLHDFFFSHVHWTLQEEEQKRSGFYIKVLELVPPADILFRLFKYWNVMRVFNALGAPAMGAKENAKLYASAPVMGIITIQDETFKSFIDVGRSFQRIWLMVTSKDISLQPLTGILFFHQRLKANDAAEFSLQQQQIIEQAYKEITSQFNVANGTVAMMFRLGYADAPTASSLKMPPAIINR